MISPCIRLDRLQGPLERGELVLTANNRLRNQILRAWAQARTAEGQSAWQLPNIFAFRSWLDDAWQQLQDLGWPQAQRLVASPLQRQILWQQVIEASELGQKLLQGRELARTADEALRSLELWNLSPASLAEEANPNTQAFYGWWRDFDAALSACGLITQESAQTLVAQAFVDGVLPPVERIHLQGFDDLAPLYRQLLDQAAREVIELEAVLHPSPRLVRTQAGNEEAEITAAARWSLARLQEDPNAVIGILVPNLGQSRAQVERIFTQVFEPLAHLPETRRYTLPFNFSAGTPLGETPLIHCALSLLALSQQRWELDPLCALIPSPFWGGPETEEAGAAQTEADYLLRHQLTDALRRASRLSFGLADLRYYAEKLGQKLNQPWLINRLVALASLQSRSQNSQGAGAWAETFTAWLECLGWPGQRRLDSQEYQQLNLWYQLLEEFARLDGAGFKFSQSQALSWLRQLAISTPFQPQTPDSPIQILGALEGAGLCFSHAWVLGLHHRQWPPLPSPNPLLPFQLQRRLAMPHASQERELSYAQALTQNYRQCAGQVVFSSPETNDEGHLNPSPLIRDLPPVPLEQLLEPGPAPLEQMYQALVDSRRFQLLDDSRGPALTPEEAVRGGSKIFKEQSDCPFHAFVRLRLGAEAPNPAVPGFSPLERGNLLHNCLADFWTRVRSLDQLKALDEGALLQLLNEITAENVKKASHQRPGELGHNFCQLEQQRLSQLLHAWLTREKGRPPFTVAEVETQRKVEFAGISLNLRLDRVDQLGNDQYLLIDYKSGKPNTNHWKGERPQEPQMPLYALVYDKPVAAIAFAQINAHDQKLLSWGDVDVPLPKLTTPADGWQQQLDSWRRILTRLAQEFIEGDARISFSNANAEGYATELLPLNRLPEQTDLIQALPSLGLTLEKSH